MIEAMKLALEAFEWNHNTDLDNNIDALRQAIEQAEQAQPDKVAIMQRIVDKNTGFKREQPVATCKDGLQVWVIPNGKGAGQFSWEPQDERFWTRMVTATVKQSLTVEQAEQAQPVAIALHTGTKQGVKWLKNVDHGLPLCICPSVASIDTSQERVAKEGKTYMSRQSSTSRKTRLVVPPKFSMQWPQRSARETSYESVLRLFGYSEQAEQPDVPETNFGNTDDLTAAYMSGVYDGRKDREMKHVQPLTDEQLLRDALYALEYASDMTKPEGMSGCDCPICTSIAAIEKRLGKA